jgi:alpha-tubulin suppressor-like RCC1 family protein
MLLAVLLACGGDAEEPVEPEPLVPVATVSLSVDSMAAVVGESARLKAVLQDENGDTLWDRAITWVSSDPAVVSVDTTGRVTGLMPGWAVIVATSERHSDAARVWVTLAWSSVAAGVKHTCGVTVDATAYCWGAATENASPLDRVVPEPVPGDLVVSVIAAGCSYQDCERFLPRCVAHTCAITSLGLGYCWGPNSDGQLGDGSTETRSEPTRVSGDLEFVSIGPGALHTCGVTSDGRVYCWGSGSLGQLGNGSSSSGQTTPGPVIGDLHFTSVSAGWAHTCAVTPGSGAYCWGFNDAGQAGAAAADTCTDRYGRLRPCSTVPVQGAGQLTLATVTGGRSHTCGLTKQGKAYCWGLNDQGQLGAATRDTCWERPCSSTPVPVSGDPTFVMVSAGGAHTCGVTTSLEALCWGANESGQLGDGSLEGSGEPVPVAGGLRFMSVSAGKHHTCGVTTRGAAYCWGANTEGQLGNGGGPGSTTPVRVGNPRGYN